MALGTNHVTLTQADKFIPELCQDEVIAAYKVNLVAADLVVNMDHTGKKGDTVHLPKPIRGAASAKAASTQVTLIANTEQELTFTINQHWEYSRLIEDIVAKQAFDSLRRFYTDDAGYALAKRIDTFVHQKGAALQSGTAYSTALVGDGVTVWNPSANTNAGNAATLTDDGIRRLIQKLDNADVPGTNRVFIVPPVEKRKLMGLPRFTEEAFTGESGSSNSIRNGIFGDLYGNKVYVSNNCERVAATDATTDQFAGLYIHKDAIVLIMQMAVRLQTQYKLEWLSDLMVADTIFGGGVLRGEAGVAFVVPEA
jgi:hypothetical protein